MIDSKIVSKIEEILANSDMIISDARYYKHASENNVISDIINLVIQQRGETIAKLFEAKHEHIVFSGLGTFIIHPARKRYLQLLESNPDKSKEEVKELLSAEISQSLTNSWY